MVVPEQATLIVVVLENELVGKYSQTPQTVATSDVIREILFNPIRRILLTPLWRILQMIQFI